MNRRVNFQKSIKKQSEIYQKFKMYLEIEKKQQEEKEKSKEKCRLWRLKQKELKNNTVSIIVQEKYKSWDEIETEWQREEINKLKKADHESHINFMYSLKDQHDREYFSLEN